MAGARIRPCWAASTSVQGYHDVTRHPEARLIPGLVLFRWDAPLFFANAELFHERVLDAAANSPTPVRWLVVTAEPVTSVDVTAADVLCELDEALHDAGIEMCFAEMKDPVKDKLKRFGLFDRFGEKTFFATIEEAVGAYLAIHPAQPGLRAGGSEDPPLRSLPARRETPASNRDRRRVARRDNHEYREYFGRSNASRGDHHPSNAAGVSATGCWGRSQYCRARVLQTPRLPSVRRLLDVDCHGNARSRASRPHELARRESARC